MKIIYVSGVVAVVGVLSLIIVFSQGDAGGRSTEVPVESVKTWRDELARGGDVSFRKEVKPDAPVDSVGGTSSSHSNLPEELLRIKSHGPIPEAEKHRLMLHLRAGIDNLAGKLLKITEDMDSAQQSESQDAIGLQGLQGQAMATTRNIALRYAQIQILGSDSYWTVTPGTRIPRNLPGMTMVTNVPARIDGKDVDVVFPVINAEHPDLNAAFDDEHRLVWEQVDTACRRINTMSYEDRRALYDAHDAASKASKRLNSGDKISPEERKRLMSVAIKSLPFGVLMKPNSRFLAMNYMQKAR